MWFFAGLSTTFPNITTSGSIVLSERLPCKSFVAPACKVFQVPRSDVSRASEMDLEEAKMSDVASLKEQVMVFQYHGAFYAVDHVSCAF
jgi:hypothetical protein